ncbi:response regulator [Cedecea davisae]|uniref:response regulator n=1 Tax=Cedecea davisae TaxID=158484 RepID=UPI00376F19AE
MTQKKKYNILLVDDHAFIRMSVAGMLAGEDIVNSVTEAESSQQAEKLIGEMAFDLVILDLSMPERDGFTVIKKVKTSALNRSAKILIFSSFYETNYINRAVQFGAHGYVCKKEDISQLILAIKAVLSGYSCFRFDDMAHMRSDDIDPVRLTPQEFDIARHISNGLTNKEIGRRLNLSEKTISSHKLNIIRKAGTRNKVEFLDFLKTINNEIL